MSSRLTSALSQNIGGSVHKPLELSVIGDGFKLLFGVIIRDFRSLYIVFTESAVAVITRVCYTLNIPPGGILEVCEMTKNNVIHHHDEEHIKAILNRMNRAIGHFEAVRKMVADGSDCSDVLIQLAAVKAAVNSIGRELLREHLSHCVADALENGDRTALEEFSAAIGKFIK